MKKYITLLFLVTLIFTGCTQTSTEANNLEENTLEPLTIGVMPDVGAVPFLMAKENGYYEELGLDVTIQVFRSALDRDTALQTGNLDGAMADMLPVIFFNDNDFPVKITSATYGNYRMVTSPENSNLKIEDVKGHKIGLSTNTVIEFATDYILDSYELTDVEKIAIPKIPLRLEMLRKGELDIATLPEPLASAALLDGGVIIRDTQELQMNPGVFICSDDAIVNKGDSIRALYTGYNKAVDYINDESIETYFSVLVDKLGFPPILEGQFDMPALIHAQMPNNADFKFVLMWMENKELTDHYYLLEDLSTNEFITTTH